MKAVATLETLENSPETGRYSEDSILRFNEGLIGFSDCKSFVLLESDGIAPFRRLQSTDRDDVGFLVLDTAYLAKNFLSIVPEREWESIGLTDAANSAPYYSGPYNGNTPLAPQGSLGVQSVVSVTDNVVLLGSPASAPCGRARKYLVP